MPYNLNPVYIYSEITLSLFSVSPKLDQNCSYNLELIYFGIFVCTEEYYTEILYI